MAPNTKRFKKRDAIMDYLRQSKAHPSAETIYTDLKAQIPDLAMGTVYRNLTLFKENGEIQSVATVKGVERFDGNPAPHVHFICSECDAVIDLDDMQVPESLSQLAAQCCGGSVEGCQLTFTGLCKKCNERNSVSA